MQRPQHPQRIPVSSTSWKEVWNFLRAPSTYSLPHPVFCRVFCQSHVHQHLPTVGWRMQRNAWFQPGTLVFADPGEFEFRFSHRTAVSFQWSVFREESSLRPAAVRRYPCLLLRGLSGMVISIHPDSSNGRRYCLRKCSRSLIPEAC